MDGIKTAELKSKVQPPQTMTTETAKYMNMGINWRKGRG
jgi:hypothetical protein